MHCQNSWSLFYSLFQQINWMHFNFIPFSIGNLFFLLYSVLMCGSWIFFSVIFSCDFNKFQILWGRFWTPRFPLRQISTNALAGFQVVNIDNIKQLWYFFCKIGFYVLVQHVKKIPTKFNFNNCVNEVKNGFNFLLNVGSVEIWIIYLKYIPVFLCIYM